MIDLHRHHTAVSSKRTLKQIPRLSQKYPSVPRGARSKFPHACANTIKIPHPGQDNTISIGTCRSYRNIALYCRRNIYGCNQQVLAGSRHWLYVRVERENQNIENVNRKMKLYFFRPSGGKEGNGAHMKGVRDSFFVHT